MAETFILDPTEVSTGRTQFDITPWVKADGIDWGDAAITAYMAETQRGQIPVDYRTPNRTITFPLSVRNVGGTSFLAARNLVQAKAAMFQQEGGWLKRVTSGGTAVFADVVNATLKLGGGWGQAYKDYDIDANLVLEVIPDFYEAEVDLGDNVETTATSIVFTDTGIRGNYPGRLRMVVDNDVASNQLGLIWGFRSRHYSSASTAALRFEAEALNALDTATKPALSGASGGTVVTHGTVSTNWTPVLDMRAAGTSYPTHTGTYRIWARCYSTSGTAVQARFSWDVGDLTAPVENPPVTVPSASQFHMLDFGEVRLDPAPSGTHRWQGVFQARGDVGTENFSVDVINVVPIDEGYGVLKAPANIDVGLATVSARDEFNQSAGALNGKTLPVGGTWSGAGDADDFSVETTGKTAQRTGVSDADVNTGRYALAGSTIYAAIAAQVNYLISDVYPAAGNRTMVLVRYVDTSNWLMAGSASTAAGAGQIEVIKRVAGTVTTLATAPLNILLPAYTTARIAVDTAGRWWVWVVRAGGVLADPLLSGYDAVLATGGALDDGRVGFYDAQTSATARTRNFNNFSAYVPASDAVIFASQSAELRSDGMFREDSTGTVYGPVSRVLGDLPRLPPSTPEARTTEVFVKASRGDFDQMPDSAADDISVRPFYRPSWLTVPG